MNSKRGNYLQRRRFPAMKEHNYLEFLVMAAVEVEEPVIAAQIAAAVP